MSLAGTASVHRLLGNSLAGPFRRIRGRLRALAQAAARRVTVLGPDQWFLVGLVFVLLLFLAVLMIQPSSVGRGGR